MVEIGKRVKDKLTGEIGIVIGTARDSCTYWVKWDEDLFQVKFITTLNLNEIILFT